MTQRKVYVVGAALIVGNRCLVGKRAKGGSSSEKWEFPGGKIEENETAEQALKRELDEELGVQALIGPHLGRGVHNTPGYTVILDVYAASLADAQSSIERRDHLALRFIGAEDIEDLDWAEPDLPALPALRTRLDAAAQKPLPQLVDPTPSP